MTKRRWFLAIAVFAALSMVAAACGDDGDEVGEDGEPAGELGAVTIEAGEPVKIASLQAISGETASLGTDQVRAIEIAIDDRGGEILGHPIEHQSEDDDCSAEGGTTGMQRIVADPLVLGVVGTSCSGAAVPAAQIMSEAGLVMISGSNTSAILTSVGPERGPANQPGYFRTAHNDGLQSEAAARFVFEELGLTTAAYIHDGDPYTQGLADGFGGFFEELGGDIVFNSAVSPDDTDMRPVLTEVAASGAELLYFPIFQPAGDFIAQQAGEVQGLEDVVLMGADGLLSDTYVALPATEGMYFSGPNIPETPAYEDFVQKYEDKFGERPIQAFHAQAYDAATILLDAIEEVAQQDGDTLTIDRQALRDQVAATENREGVATTYTCNEFGDCAFPKIDVVQNTEEQGTIDQVRRNVLFTFDPEAA